MKFLTTEEATNWCQVLGLDLDARSQLFYSLGGSHTFSLEIREKVTDAVLLSDYLVRSREDMPFAGALLWITGYGIWGDNSEKTGSAMIKQMRLGYGEPATLHEKPGHLFAPDEVYEAHSYLLLPILFGWDALFVPKTGDYFVSMSHPGIAQAICRNARIYEQLRKRLQDWTPREDEKSLS